MKQVVDSFYNWYSDKVRNPKSRWLIVLGTLAYLFSPLDISPDVFPIIGWIDDGIVITLLTTELSRLVLDYRQNRKRVKTDTTENLVTVDATSVETK
ncbi:YkvA family protein [Gloeocapsa sp. PCC 73106]|uniref:YkvA family protein n=1 Tax=Gloeocapsa sp. PCC 73106 TaxID=102232 RepID=UPI0002AD1577|nr:YkvA family protein [Gloeocapsa sp. PCC 73106]ELR97234.1 hypothetical protein GLO73106DRAFT_00010400 [Gloeocapsa sp. PCC 73106]